MKLTDFRIQNFKSIKDTGWCKASSDNITALIGQNEAGKTAVLEALYCFDRRELKDAYLREDGVYPTISCSFTFTTEEAGSILDGLDDDGSVQKYFVKKGGVTLTRTWAGLEETKSILQIDDAKIEEILSAVVPLKSRLSEAHVSGTETTQERQTETIDDPKPETAASPLTLDSLANRIYEHTPDMELFDDFGSLLPPFIDLTEIENEKSTAEGVKGARNFLSIVGLTTKDLAQPHGRNIAKKIRKANQELSQEFQSFWRQYIGKSNKIEIEFELRNHDDKDAATAGKPYLCFWVKDAEELLHPAQRSQGVQWFLSFFLQLKASAKSEATDDILLIDEPGASLHAKAQSDVLKVFEDIKDNLQIFYTTHSPYLIEADSLYRILAVQRADVDDSNSETEVFDVHKLGSASRDTLLPIYTLIGVSLDHQRVIKAKNNIILEEPSAYYYLASFKLLTGNSREMNFLPATGATNIPLLVNLFLGWGLQFIVMTDDDPEGKKTRRNIKKSLYANDPQLSADKLLGIGYEGIEDIFAKGDFRKHILGEAGIKYTDTNSKYMLDSGKPKLVSAIKFYKRVRDNKLVLSDLSNKTQANINKLLIRITSRL